MTQLLTYATVYIYTYQAYIVKKKWQKRQTRRTRRPYGSHPMDFPESKRERMGDPDYYQRLNEDELDFISKFNEEYVNGSFLGTKHDDYCEDDIYSSKKQRNELEREHGAAKRDLLSWSRRTKRKNPRLVTEKAFEYANYLYVVTGDESYLIREETDLQNNTDEEGWERF